MILLKQGNPRILESWKPFQDFFIFLPTGEIIPDVDKVKSLNSVYDFVLINCSTEHWGSEKIFPAVAWIHDLFMEHFGSNFLVLTHDPSDEPLRKNIIYFPFWLWHSQQAFNVDPAPISISQRKYLVSNLNFAVRDFRIANYLMMMQAPKKTEFLVTMYNLDLRQKDYNGHFDLTAEESEAWEKTKTLLPATAHTQLGPRISGPYWWSDVQHPAFIDSYIHLVSEACVHDKIFLTEKTWKPIANGQIFLIWGNAGTINHLRQLKVDVFDDIVDHSYDLEPDHRRRLNMIHREIDRLVQQNLEEIYKTTQVRRQQNFQNFISGESIRPWASRTNDILSAYGQRIDIPAKPENTRID